MTTEHPLRALTTTAALALTLALAGCGSSGDEVAQRQPGDVPSQTQSAAPGDDVAVADERAPPAQRPALTPSSDAQL